MSTCETVSAADPNDPWDADDCGSGFHFPDDEGLIQAEFEKNVPFALATAVSAGDPDNPWLVVAAPPPSSSPTRSPCPTATPSRWPSWAGVTTRPGG